MKKDEVESKDGMKVIIHCQICGNKFKTEIEDFKNIARERVIKFKEVVCSSKCTTESIRQLETTGTIDIHPKHKQSHKQYL